MHSFFTWLPTVLAFGALGATLVALKYVLVVRDDIAEFAADTDVLGLSDRVDSTRKALQRLSGRFYAALRHEQIDPNAGSADGAEHDPTPITHDDALDSLERRENLRAELLPKSMEGRIAAMQQGKVR